MALQTDPIADFLTRIRNAQKAHHEWIEAPTSKMKERIAEILRKEGFIRSYDIKASKPRDILRVQLRYEPDGTPIIRKIRRISRPGSRTFSSAREAPKWGHGIGMAILTTSKGVMTDQEAKDANLGGEVIFTVQ